MPTVAHIHIGSTRTIEHNTVLIKTLQSFVSVDAAIVKAIMTTATYLNKVHSGHLALPCVFCDFFPLM